jgi:DNA-binding response OmpR family regulator
VTKRPGPEDRPPLVLLAEDEAIIAMELEDSLQTHGFDIAGPFSTCAEAEEWLKAGLPDAAILDNSLKDGPCDGLILDLGRRGVPVVIYSGHQQEGGDRSPSPSNVTWVMKPAPFSVLLKALGRE